MSSEDADGAAMGGSETLLAPTGQASAVPPALRGLPDAIGPYRIISLLGEGGMGVVYLAEQTEPIRRRVALKVIKLGMDTRQVVARFEAERQALELMDHPNIARVIDAGATPDGRPYFVMEYVAGVAITEYCDAHRLSTRARLELLVHVCGAVQHAHQKGVIHRDLKPSNVLVAEPDGRAVPKIIDFGIAKATQQTLTERTLTELGQCVGTPEYMSPEQAGADGFDADSTTDIYSLGVVLYELLVGALPFDPAALRRAGYEEMRRIIREEEPPKPSTRVNASTSSDVAEHRHTDVASLRRQLAGDLDWITLKAIEKDRSRRYASASELAADIGRYLKDEAVLASPPSATYRAKKFIRRNRLMVTAAGLTAGAVLSGLVISSILYVREGRARRDAVRSGQQASRAEATALLEKSSAEAAAAREAAARRISDEKTQVANDALASVETSLYFNNINLVEKELAARNLVRVDELLAGSPPRLRNWEWHYFSRAAHMEDMAFTPLRRGLMAFGADPSGQHFFAASTYEGLHVAIGDLRSGRVIRTVKLDASQYRPPGAGGQFTTTEASFSPDGRMFIVASIPRTTLVGTGFDTTIWDVSSGSVRYFLPPSLLARFAWSPDSAELITWQVPPKPPDPNAHYPLVVRDARTGAEVKSIGRYAAVVALAFSPDGGRLALATQSSVGFINSIAPERSVIVLDVRTGNKLIEFATSATIGQPISGLRWSPDGGRVAALDQANVVRAWDSSTGVELWTMPIPETSWSYRRWEAGVRHSLAFAADGKCLVVDTGDRLLRVLDMLTGNELRQLSGATGGIKGLITLPGGGRVASVEDAVIRFWDPQPRLTGRKELTNPQGPARDMELESIALSRDQQILAGVSTGGVLQVFDLTSGEQRITRGPLKPAFTSWTFGIGPNVAFNRDATQVIASIPTASISQDGSRHVDLDQWIVDLKNGRELAAFKFPTPDAAREQSAQADDQTLAVTMPALDVAGMRAVVITKRLKASHEVRLSPADQARLGKATITLFGEAGSTIDFWDVLRRKVTRVAVPKSVGAQQLSYDGQKVAIRVSNSTEPLGFEQRIYDVRSGALLRTISGGTSTFANDGTQLAVHSDIGTITLWDTRSWRRLLTMSCPPNPSALAFNPDDARLAVLARDGFVTVFETRSGRQVATLQESSGSLRELSLAGFHPDGFASTVTFSGDGTKISTTRLRKNEMDSLIQIRTWDGTPLRSSNK